MRQNKYRHFLKRKSKQEHNSLEQEKSFNDTTVDVLSYVQYISKTGELHSGKEIPVPATAHETKYTRYKWLRWFKRKISIADEEMIPVDDDGSLGSSDEGNNAAENLWPTNRLSKMAYFALVFHASNILRFPYSCYRFGGSIFLLVYFILMIVVIQPVIYLEMIIGQFSQSGVSGLSRFDIYSDGFTSVLTLMCLIFVPYDEIVLGYAGAYVLGTVAGTSGNCDPSWNKLNSCVPYINATSISDDEEHHHLHIPKIIFFNNGTVRTSLLSSELYFRQVILNQAWDGQNYKNELNGNVLAGLVFTYVMVFFAIQNNLTSKAAQYIIRASVLLPISMVILLTLQLFWAGASHGIISFLELKVEYLATFEFWAEAIRLAFTSTGIGYGFYERLSSRNPTTFNSFYSTSWIICILAFCTCTLSSLIVFAELGILQHIFQVENLHEIFAEKTAISFISLAGAMHKLGDVWPPIIFFAIINLCGLWQQTVATEICSAMVSWCVPDTSKKYINLIRRISVFVVIVIQGLWSSLLHHSWPYILDSFHLFGGSWAASIIIFAEIYVVIYLYGFHLLMIDIEIIMQFSVPTIFQRQIKYVVPIVMLMAVLILTIDVCKNPLTYYLDIIRSPIWITLSGFVLNIIPVVALVFIGISANKRRKEALSHKALGQTLNLEGKRRKYEMAYYRLLNRRKGIFQIASTEDEIDFSLGKEQDCLQRRRTMQLEMKVRLHNVMRNKIAKASWQRAVNKVLIHQGRVNTIMNLIQFAIRECDRIKNIQESQYLDKVLKKFSIESIFLSANMENRENPKDEYLKFLQGVLTSVTIHEMPQNHPPLSPYELLIGKRIPTQEEDRLEMIVRIKKHMGIPYKRDEFQLKKLVRTSEEKSHHDSCFNEEPPHEFFMESYYKKTIVRVIVVKGGDHSLLRSLHFPRPPEIRIPELSIGAGKNNVLKTLKNIQIEIEKDMKRKRIYEKPTYLQPKQQQLPNNSNNIKKSIKSPTPTNNYNNSTTFLYRPLRFPNWHFGAAIYPYKILPNETYIVVLTNSNDIAQKNKYRWLQMRRKRKIYPAYTIEKYGDKEPFGTYAINLAEMNKYNTMIQEKEDLINAPADIIYHNDDGSSDDSLQLSTTSNNSINDDVLLPLEMKFIQNDTKFEHNIIPKNIPTIKKDNKEKYLENFSSNNINSMQQPFYTKYGRNDINMTADSQKTMYNKEDNSGGISSSSKKDKKNNKINNKPTTGKRPYIKSNNFEPSLTVVYGNPNRDREKENNKEYKIPNVISIDHFPYKNTLSLKAIWSQNSVRRGIHDGDGQSMISSSRPLKTQRSADWNTYEKFAYRSEGRTLLVEHREDAEKVIVWASSDDSIASIKEESKESMAKSSKIPKVKPTDSYFNL